MTKSFDPTKPVRTREGNKARVISDSLENPSPILAIITEPNGREHPILVNTDGRVLLYGIHAHDLVNVREKLVRWVNIYPNNVACGNGVWESRLEADKKAAHTRIACVRVEVEEGEGL